MAESSLAPGCEGPLEQLGAVRADFRGLLGEDRLCPWRLTISRWILLSFVECPFPLLLSWPGRLLL